ncbi:MAG: hypothetical protein GX175_08420 [Halanaerobiaceae bacterium]|jgi:hypothetical protein|nr:hypothetical protein [Halanaerobiaceae bacterium]
MTEEYERGYRDGLWYGKVNTYGELVIEAFQPDVILPGYTIPELMKIAIEQKKNELKKLLTVDEVYSRIVFSLENNLPLSLVRLGDGEGIALGQGYCKTEAELAQYDFLEYAGISVPDYQARDELAGAVREADIVGIPTNLMPDFQPLVSKALACNGINVASLTLTSANIHQYLFRTGYFKKILGKRNVRALLVGNKAGKLAEVLQYYCNIAGVISPVNGVNSIPTVLKQLKNYHFNLLLVAAGMPAVIISSKAAKLTGCTALDIGHLADQIITTRTLDLKSPVP